MKKYKEKTYGYITEVSKKTSLADVALSIAIVVFTLYAIVLYLI